MFAFQARFRVASASAPKDGARTTEDAAAESTHAADASAE